MTRTGKKRSRKRFGPTQRSRSKKKTCAKCRKQFRVRKYLPAPVTCYRKPCRVWSGEQRKIRESIARLSAPEVEFPNAALFGIDPARRMPKSAAFGMAYGHSKPVMAKMIQSSAQNTSKAFAEKMAELFPDTATRPKARVKNVAFPCHDEITYEIEIEQPAAIDSIEIGKWKS